MAVGKSPAHDLVTQFKMLLFQFLPHVIEFHKFLIGVFSIVTIKKLCDGLDITLGDFFSTPEFDTLEQEIK